MVGMSAGRPGRFSLPTPMPMAPEDTSTSWFPAFFKSDSTFTSPSTRRMFSRPVGWARVEVPTFTTILIAVPSQSLEEALIKCFCGAFRIFSSIASL